MCNKKNIRFMPVLVDFGDEGIYISPRSCSDEQLDELINVFIDFLLSSEIELCDVKLTKIPRDKRLPSREICLRGN